MLILGLLLVLLSAASVAVLWAYNSSGGPEQTIVLFGRDWLNVTPLETFLAGIVLALIFCLGLWMVVTTERRRRVARSEYRAARRDAKDAARAAKSASRDRDNLAKQLERERSTVEPEPVRARETVWTPPQESATAPPVATEDPARHRGIGRHFRRQTRTEETTPK